MGVSVNSIKMAKYILAAFLLSTAIAICIKAEERIETITFLTSYCDDCGMDFTGSVAVKVCGDSACCFTPWMQADFREGEVAHLSVELFTNVSNTKFQRAT